MAKRGRPKAQPMNPLTASRITEAREGKGFSKTKLSKQIHCDASAVRKWEKGTNNITEENLEAIANVCDVPITWLKGETPEDIAEESKKILDSFNPETAEDHAKEFSEQTQAESLAIIYALKACGYPIENIKDKQKFYAYMKNAIETYINMIN